MKKVLSMLIILLMLPVMVNAANIEFVNQAEFNGNKGDEFYDMEPTSDGGYIVVGETASTNKGFSNYGERDAIIVKYSATHQIEWVKTFGGNQSEAFEAVVVTSDGEYIAVGGSSSTDIDGITHPGDTDHSSYDDTLIVRYDKNGNQLWYDSIGTSGTETFNDVVASDDGSVIVSFSSADIEELTTVKDANILVTKYDKTGNRVWTSYCTSDYSEHSYGMTSTQDGGVVIVGRSYSGKFMDIELEERSLSGFIVKFDKDGNYVWADLFGGTGYEEFFDVIETKDGKLVAVGATDSEDIEGITLVGDDDAVVVQYSADGKIEWIKTVGSEENDEFSGISELSNGNYAVVGDMSFNYFIAEISNKGKLVWQFKSEMRGKLLDVEEINGVTLAAGYNYNDSRNGVVTKLEVTMEYEETPTENGSYNTVLKDNQVIITPEPEDGYVLDDVIVKDLDGDDVPVTKQEDGSYVYEFDRDTIITVIFVKNYKLTLNPVKNGTATLEKVDNRTGRIKAVPDEGYEFGEIIIEDTTGKLVVYEERDGYYYFNINDDLVITVTFDELPKEVVKGDEEEKDEENPKTADAFIYYACAVVCSLFGIWSVEQYRKTVKE